MRNIKYFKPIFFLLAIVLNVNNAFADFSDTFDTDTSGAYTITDTWTTGGFGSISYDASGQRLEMLTGNDIAIQLSREVPASTMGAFELDFLPTRKYPSGGIFSIVLRQDANNYYVINNTDGYGSGELKKFIGGVEVDSAALSSEYTQNTQYHVAVNFSPTDTLVDAFGQSISISSDTGSILVSSIEIGLTQQDGYIDNVYYNVYYGSPDTTAPVWDAGGSTGICAALDNADGGSVTVEFGSATDAVSGTNVSYTVYYALTSSWDGSDWGNNSQAVVGTPQSGTNCGVNATVVSGLTTGESYTFGIRVSDELGNEDTNTLTSVVVPSGVASQNLSDTFDTDTSGAYTITDTWTTGGFGSINYDASGQRLEMLTGNDIAIQLSREVPASTMGVFELDFLPTRKYPSGGIFSIVLRQDANNYYVINNTDGYGSGELKKFIGGVEVDSAALSSEYTQNTQYHVAVSFSPTSTQVDAFGQSISISSDTGSILVSSIEISLTQQDGYIDNFFYDISTDPQISITSIDENAFIVESNLFVSLSSRNLQPEWGIKVIFNQGMIDEQVLTDYTMPFEVTFSGIEKGEHTLDAYVIDDLGDEVSGELTHDSIISIAFGDYYLAIGDSITLGMGDDIASDDTSIDGRNTGGGYTPILNDFLTAQQGYPHTIVNEGIGGETSSKVLLRLQSTLDSYPDAQFVLVLYGTNDSYGTNPVDSGLYKDNMQEIIDIIVTAGKIPMIAKVPITLGPCSTCTPFADPTTADRNLLIQEYNAAIDELVATNSTITITPPDLYDHFSNNLDQFSDNLHPNGNGYQAIAGLWSDAIVSP